MANSGVKIEIDPHIYEKFKAEFEAARERALEQMGQQAEGQAAEVIREAGAIDTGRLWNSITHAIKKDEGKTYTYKDDNGKSYTEQVGRGISDDAVVVGTNVEYAIGIETGTHRKAGGVHMLQKGVTESKEEFKAIMQKEFGQIK